jgi:hypothetical protein
MIREVGRVAWRWPIFFLSVRADCLVFLLPPALPSLSNKIRPPLAGFPYHKPYHLLLPIDDMAPPRAPFTGKPLLLSTSHQLLIPNQAKR